jgi:eukaryotic-like serine/threonine-protein kinase
VLTAALTLCFAHSSLSISGIVLNWSAAQRHSLRGETHAALHTRFSRFYNGKGPFVRTKLIALGLIGSAAAASGVYAYLHRGPRLSETDAIVLTDFNNATGESVFDSSLREALGVSLAQSPRLNLLSSEKVEEVLQGLGHSSDEALTQDLAQKVCERASAKALIAGSIRKSATGYAISLDALTCATGSRITGTRGEANTSREVLPVLGRAATELRKELGEEPSSIQQFDIPLARATSPSLEALKLYSEGRKLTRNKGALEGVTALRKAVELDPRFALAYSSLAVNHYNMNQSALASDEIRQAFEMGDRQTARERLQITTLYYDLGTGDVSKAIASYKSWAQLYPRDDVPRGDLSSEYFLIGDYENAARSAKEALHLEPSSMAWYENLSTAEIALGHWEEARAVLNEALAKKLDDPSLHGNLYALAFLRDDAAGMEHEVSVTGSKAGGEDLMLAMQADTEAFSGHLKKARELSRRAVESAQRAQLGEPAAIWRGFAALREAVFGNTGEARKEADEILKLAPGSRDAQLLTALVLARVGETQQSQAILDDLRARYVSNTVVQMVWIPSIRAQMELLRKNPDEAITSLNAVTPYERGELIGNLSNCCMIPVYLRGEAYLAAGQGAAARAEFQKIADSRGIVVNCWAGSLSKLGMARAQALAGYKTAARTAYEHFFSQWNTADPDLPVLKTARAEYAKLK